MEQFYEPLLASARDATDGNPADYRERFTPLLIAEASASQFEFVRAMDADFGVRYLRANFFESPAAQGGFPPDVDTTAVLYAALLDYGCEAREAANKALNDIMTNVNNDGVVCTYWTTDARREIVDPVVCANVAYLAMKLKRTAELRATLFYLKDHLVHGDWHAGSRYYHSPDTLLWRLSRSVPGGDACPMSAVVRDALTSRVASSTYPLDVAQRVLAASQLGIVFQEDADLLLATDPVTDALYRYGRSPIFIQSRELTAALHAAATRDLFLSLNEMVQVIP